MANIFVTAAKHVANNFSSIVKKGIPSDFPDRARAEQRADEVFDAQKLSYTIDAPREARRVAQENYTKDPTPANAAEVARLSDINAEKRRNRAASSAIHQGQKARRLANTLPLVLEGLGYFEQAGRTELDRIEKIEKEIAESVGVPWEASQSYLALAERVRRIRPRIETLTKFPDDVQSPKSELGDFVKF